MFERGQTGYATAAHIYNPRFVPVRARSGGHSYAGYSTLSDGVVLDLRQLNSITVDKQAATTSVGAGAQLIDVYSGLANAGATLPAGSCPSVGVSGVTLGGGFGLAGRYYGLTTDNLVAVNIVTADGQLRTVNGQTDADLLWALKGGGGGNFGIVTEFTFNVHQLPVSAAYFNVTWPWSSAGEAIAAWQSWAPHTTDKITSILHLNSGSPPSINANGQYLGSSAALPGLLGPLLAVPGAALASHLNMPYLQLQLLLAGCTGKTVAACHTVGAAPGGTLPRNTFNAKSDYVATPLSSAGRSAMVAAVQAPGSGSLLCDSYGGRGEPRSSDRDRIRASPAAVLHPVLRGRRNRDLDRPSVDQDAPLCLRTGLPELHRSDPAGLAAGLLCGEPPALGGDSQAGRPRPLLQLPAGTRRLRSFRRRARRQLG